MNTNIFIFVFIALTMRAKMTNGGNSSYVKLWVKLAALERNRRFSVYFRT